MYVQIRSESLSPPPFNKVYAMTPGPNSYMTTQPQDSWIPQQSQDSWQVWGLVIGLMMTEVVEAMTEDLGAVGSCPSIMLAHGSEKHAAE
jgi:hypothetical protein